MRYAATRTFQISYDGKLKETHIIPASEQKLDNNRNQIKSLFKAMKTSSEVFQDNNKSYLFKNIDWSIIQDFIFEYSFHEDQEDLKQSIVDYTKKISDIFNLWDVAFISLKKVKPEESYMIAAQVRDIGHEVTGQPKKPTGEEGWYVGNKQKISGPGIEAIGLDSEQIDQAKMNAELSGVRQKPNDNDYRNARNKPLLMVHILNLIDRKKGNQLILKNVPAIGVSFPNSEVFRTVNYTVGPVWLKQFKEEQFDTPDEENDYDLEP